MRPTGNTHQTRIRYWLCILLCIAMIGGGIGLADTYTDNGDQTVTAQGTDLIWQQSDDGLTRSFTDATGYCEDLDLGGYTDWRLPTATELQGLWNDNGPPYIDDAFSCRWDYYWSATQGGNDNSCASGYAYSVGFGEKMTACDLQSFYNFTRCVRGAEALEKPYITVSPDEYTFVPLNIITEFDSPGSSPRGLAFDGTDLWLVDSGSNEIYQVATDGELLATFDAPMDDPRGLTFDGAYFWCAGSSDDTLYMLDTDFSIVDRFDSPGSDPSGLSFDGTYLWCADASENMIYKLETDGDIVDSFEGPDAEPSGLAFDGTDLWVADRSSVEIYRLEIDGDLVGSYDAPGYDPYGLTWADDHLWNVDRTNLKVYKLATDYQEFTITNAGISSLVIDSIALDGEDDEDFSIANDNCTNQTLAASGECTFEVHMDLDQTGDKSAQVVIAYDNLVDADLQSVEVPIDYSQTRTIEFSESSYTVDKSEDSIEITVVLTPTLEQDDNIEVDYTTSDDTAVSGEDYTSASGTLEWTQDGDSEKTFTIEILGNEDQDEDVTFTITLSDPSGAVLGTRNTAEVTITADGGDDNSGCFISSCTSPAKSGWTIGLALLAGLLTAVVLMGKGKKANHNRLP